MQRPLPRPGNDVLRYLLDLYDWLRPFERITGARVTSTGIDIDPPSPATDNHPFKVTDASIAGDGWYITVQDGAFCTANQAVGGTQWTPALADNEVTEAVSFLYLHSQFDADELLTTPDPELVILEGTDPVLTADPFTHAYLQIAKLEQVGDVAAPALTITQYVRTAVLHRKVNTAQLWSYGATA